MPDEYRVSPDGTVIALRRDEPDDSPMLYGFMTKKDGGHYGSDKDVEGWDYLVRAEQA